MAIGHPSSFIVPTCRNISAATMRNTLFSSGDSACHRVTMLAIDSSLESSFGSQRLHDVDARGARRRHQRREDRRGHEQRARRRRSAARRASCTSVDVARRPARASTKPPTAPATTPAPAITAPSPSTRVSRWRGADPIASRMPNSRVRALTENASTPATPTTAIASATAGEAAEHERVQPIRREHFGAHVVQRRRALDRLIGRQLADDPRDRRHQRVRIRCARARTAGRRRSPARTGDRRVIAGPGTTFSSSTSAATPTMRRGFGADVDELHHRIGPHAGGGSPRPGSGTCRCARLWLTITTCSRVAAIGVVEVAAGDDRHAERGEESRRHGAEPRARILFAVGLRRSPRPRTGSPDRTRRRRATARPCRRRRARRRAARVMRRIASL